MRFKNKRNFILFGCLVILSGCATTGKQVSKDGSCKATTSLNAPCSSETTGSITVPIRQTEQTHSFHQAEFASTLATPEVLAALARRDAAGEEIAKARAMMLPTVSLNAQAGLLQERSNSFPGAASGSEYSYGLSVEVPLYQGGRAQAAMKAARASHRAAGEAAKDSLLSTTYGVLLANAAVQRQKTTIAVRQRQEQQLRRLRDSVSTEVAAGAASQADLNDINRQLARLAVVREQAKIGLASAEQILLQYNISVPAGAKTPSFAARLSKSEPELIETALRNNPRIAQRSALVESATARVEEAKGAYKPTVSLSLGLNGEESETYSNERDHSANAFVRFSIPIYTGGMRSADLRQKHSEETAASYERDAAVNGVTAAVRAASARRARAEDAMRLAHMEKRNAQAALDGVKQERKLGDRTVYDEIRLNEDVANADIHIAEAQYEVLAAEYTLAAEIGMLSDFVGASVPGEKRSPEVALN